MLRTANSFDYDPPGNQGDIAGCRAIYLWREVLVVRQSDNLGYWSLFTCRSRKAGLIRHPNLSHGQTTSATKICAVKSISLKS